MTSNRRPCFAQHAARTARLRCGAGLALLAVVAGPGLAASPPGRAAERPNVLIVTIDTVRADRLSGYGYSRRTSPSLDRIMASGARFTEARTVEPLTTPALGSMLTSQYPHEHGSTRNGLRLRAGQASLPKVLRAAGFRTAAFVGNWTLRDRLSGLGEHFEEYEEVLTRKRWLGMVSSETTADDLVRAADAWLVHHARSEPERPFLLWVHFVEPHAPYRLHPEELAGLGLASRGKFTPQDRYDTEIAFVDRRVGSLLRTFERLGLAESTLVVFTSDHGESLGEHNEWGHGRNLYEPALHIPLSFTWAGRLTGRTIDAPALNIDIAPTVLGLAGLKPPPEFNGYDWSAVLRDGAKPPFDRITRHQAHRGAVLNRHDSNQARRAGLLEVGLFGRNRKEVYSVQSGRHRVFDLRRDPRELTDLNGDADASAGLLDWARVVYQGLNRCDAQPPEPLDEESIEQLKSLGYTE